MGSPRVDVVFWFRQCDKKNHGWREGPPLTVPLLKFRSAGRAFTLPQSQFRTKKEYCFALPARALTQDIGRFKWRSRKVADAGRKSFYTGQCPQ